VKSTRLPNAWSLNKSEFEARVKDFSIEVRSD